MRKQDMENQFSKKTRKKARSIQAQRIFRSRWFKSLVAMGSVVVFCTVYSLIIPAATLTEDQASADAGIVLEEAAPSEPQPVEAPAETPAPEPVQEDAPKEEPVVQAAAVEEAPAEQAEKAPAAASSETVTETPAEAASTAASEQSLNESAAAGSGSEETKTENTETANTAAANETAPAEETSGSATDETATEGTDAALTTEETTEEASTADSEESVEETTGKEEEVGTVSELKGTSGNLEAVVRFAEGAGIPENATLAIYGGSADTGKVQDALWSGSMDSIERSTITTDLSEYVSFAVKDVDGNDITPDSDCSIEISFGSEADLSDPGENRIKKYGTLVVGSDGNVSVTGTSLSTGDGHTYATFSGKLSGNTFGFAVTTADKKVNYLEGLSGKTSDGAVEASLTFGKDAKVPEGSTLTVESASVSESSVLDKLWGNYEGVDKDTVTADDVQFVKFVIRDKDGKEISPETKVSVKLTFYHEADLSSAAEGKVKKYNALAVSSDGTITLGSKALSAENGTTTASFADVSAKSSLGYAVSSADKKVVYATRLTGKSEDGTIEASLRLTEEAKIPEGSLLKVTPVTGESVQKTLLDNIWTDTSIIDPDTIELTDSGLAAVTIIDKDGNALKPEADGALTLTFDKEADLKEAARKMVKRAKTIAMTEENVKLSDDGLSAAEGKTKVSYTGIVDGQTFGYAVSTAKQKTNFLEGKLTYEGEDYTVEVSINKDNQIPEGSELKVKELDQDSEEFKKKLDQAAEAVQKDAEKNSSDDIETTIDDSSVRMFDITIQNEDGDEIQPNGNVRVSVQYKNAVKVGADAKMKAVHFDEKNDEVQVLTPETKADTSDTEKKVHEVRFNANGFSVYAIVGTEVITVDYLTDEGSTYEISVDVSGISNLPEKASLSVKPVTGAEYEEYKAKATAAVGATAAQVTYANLLDISIVDKDGNEFQPKDGETVKVEIKLLDKKESSDTQIVHFGEDTEVLDSQVDGDTVSFETSGFSIYAIIGTDDTGHQVRVKYVFQNADGSEYLFTNTAGETHDNQIIKNGEALENVGIPSINPNGETFNGWYIYDPTGGPSGTGALTANKISFYPTTIALSTGAASTTITSTSVAISDDDNTFDKEGADDPEVDYTIYVRPSFGPVYYLTFWNEVDGNVIYTKLQIPADANVYDISQQEAVPPDAIVDPETGEVVEYVTYAFTGWSETPGTYEDMKEDTDSRTEITNTTITVTEDMDLYPIFRRAHWISFYTAETGSGASYVPPVYIQSGQQASTKRPSDPTWEGHTFVGWFTTEDDNPLSNNETTTGSFNWNQTLNEDITLYAHWNAGTANYTIVYWRQLVSDAKNATDANKHYEYAGQENKTGRVTSDVTPGTVATVPVGYQINTSKSDTSTTVLADGTAVLNVYLDRKLITMNFVTQNNPTRYYTYTGLYGQTLAQNGYSWPSDYGWQYRGTNGTFQMSYLGEFVLPANRITGANNTVTTINFYTNNASSRIYYYLQNEDGTWPLDYIDAGITAASSIQLPEKFTGFTVDAYQYNNNGRGGDYGTWTPGTAGVTEPQVRNGMAIRYRRLNYVIKFLDSRNGTELADVPAVSVAYGRTLTSYKPTVTDITPPSSEYEWTGKWYADQDCTTEFDWSQSMPSHDIAVYVNWNEIWYWIKIDPDGGELTSTEATWFWEPKGELVEEYHDVTRTYVEDPNGTWYYHYDEFDDSDPDADKNKSGTTYVDSEGRTRYARRAYYTQDASLSTDGKTYSEDPKAYSLVGWYEVDKETGELHGQYDFAGGVSGDTILRAVWRTVGQYNVQYSVEGVNEDGTPLYEKDESGAYTETRVTGANPPTDNNKYADKSNSAIGAAIGVEPTGYVFTGWYYNGKTYNPGDKYTLMAELDVLDIEGLDNVKDDTITIYPVFVKYEDLPVKTTHIYWYGNTVDNTGASIEGVTSSNEPKDETTHQDLQVNKAIDIKKYTELPNVSTLYAGYEFKGWAKLEESAPNSTAVTPWLVWDKDTETYTVDGVAGVTKIAADEILSASGDYEKLVAVWEKKKYSVTVIKEVESTLSGDQDVSFVFTPSFPAGLGTDVQTNFSLSGISDPKVFDDGNTDNPQTKFVPYKSTFSITEQSATGFELTSVTGEYTDDAGVKHTIDNLSNGAEIEVLGDTVITFKNTRQLVDVVVKKTLVNPYIASTDGVDFSFTATWGTDGSANFTVNSSNADGYRIKDVPVGAEMVITEGADEAYEYTVTAAGTNSADSDEVANTYTFEVPATDETVTFTNTVVTVDGVNVTKTDDKTPATGLSGAEFTLTRNIKLDGSGSTWITIADPYSGTLTSGANGVLINAGTLPVGTYKLTESKSPDGYIITNNEVVFSVAEAEDGKLITIISGDNASVSDDGKTLTITNQTGQELPHTGGPGTLLYTLSGIVLMLGAALMYGFRMRRRERRLN